MTTKIQRNNKNLSYQLVWYNIFLTCHNRLHTHTKLGLVYFIYAIIVTYTKCHWRQQRKTKHQLTFFIFFLLIWTQYILSQNWRSVNWVWVYVPYKISFKNPSCLKFKKQHYIFILQRSGYKELHNKTRGTKGWWQAHC
jgi:hypothetical protein